MPIKSLIYLFTLVSSTAGALIVTPLIGLFAYLLTYNVNPLSFWWANYVPDFFHRYAFILGTATILGTILHASKVKLYQRLDRQEILLIFFVLTVWLSTAIGLQNLTDYDYTFKMTKVAVILLIASRLITEYKYFNMLVWIYILSALYSGYEIFSSEYLSFRMGRLQTGVGGSDFSEGNFLAAHYLFILPLVAKKFITGNWQVKLISLLSAAFIVNSLILIESRGSFLALAVGGFSALIFSPGIYRKKVVTVLIIGAIGFGFLSDQTFWSRMGSMKAYDSDGYSINNDTSGIDESTAGRIAAWQAAFKMFTDHPLGIGEGNFFHLVGSYNPSIAGKDTHNTFLRCLAELGIQGFLILILMIYTAFSTLSFLSRNIQNQGNFEMNIKLDIFVLRVSLIMFLVTSCFLTHTYIEEFYWLLMLPLFLKRSLENTEFEKLSSPILNEGNTDLSGKDEPNYVV